jgi:hypothetical protein
MAPAAVFHRQPDVEHSQPAPSAFGDPLIVFSDPDRIQLQMSGVSGDGGPGGPRAARSTRGA